MTKYIKLFNNHTQYETFMGSDELMLPNVSHCIEENEVHYNPLHVINGHEYIDLGLPSGTLWATMNIGAESEKDFGLYFAWGETQGYTADQISGSATPHRDFTWADYQLGDGGSGSTNMTKYNETDGKTVLDLEDDAVNANWGSDWHMPTLAQISELSEYATFSGNPQEIDGKYYYVVTVGDKSLLFPETHFANSGEILNWWDTYIWSSTIGTFPPFRPETTEAYGIIPDGHWTASNRINSIERFTGVNIRGVVGNDDKIWQIISDDITTSYLTITLDKTLPLDASNITLLASSTRNDYEAYPFTVEKVNDTTYTFIYDEPYDRTPFNCYYFKIEFTSNGKTYNTLSYKTSNCLS